MSTEAGPIEHARQCRNCRIDFDQIENGDQLLRLLGYYPCFHDATVWRASLEELPESKSVEFRLGVTLHQMTDEVDEAGVFKCVDHTLVELRMAGVCVEQIQLESFPEIVGAMEATLTEGTDRTWRVAIGGVLGGAIALRCESVTLEAATRVEPS